MTRLPKATYTASPGVRPPGANARALRRRAEAYREKADELEAMLRDTQDEFTTAFAALDAQTSTRDRITRAARGSRGLGIKENQ